MIINTYDPKKRQNVFVGYFENQVFYKKVSTIHFMKIENGYGIQEDVLQKLHSLNCQRIIIDNNASIFETSLIDWLKRPIKNYGNGPQRFLPIKTKKIQQEQLQI